LPRTKSTRGNGGFPYFFVLSAQIGLADGVALRQLLRPLSGDAGPIHLGCGHAVGVLAVQHNGARCGLVYLFSKNALSFAAAEAAAVSPRRGGGQEENGKRVYFSL